MSILMGTLAIATIITTGRMTYYGSICSERRPAVREAGKKAEKNAA